MHRSVDGGVTWTFSGYGMNRGGADILYLPNDSCWLAMANTGLFRTKNEGEQWQLLKESKHEGQWFYNEVLEWDSTSRIYFIIDDTLFVSNDLGDNFQTIVLPDSLHPRIRGVGVHEQSSTIFVSLKNGTVRSSDMGVTWEIVADNLHLLEMRTHPSGALYAIFAEEQWVPSYYQINPYLFRSIDGGLNWEKTLDNKINSFVINGLGEIYASGVSTGTQKSIDGGDNWMPVQHKGRNILANQGNQLFAHDNDENIFMSVDFGNNWQTLPTAVNDNGLYHACDEMAFDQQNRLYTSVWEYTS
ncbi:MAG TPA: hypothetical protein PKJ68_06495, partial [Candidatus Woesebacteria bacterium]|nr:hypothetical protein [Candidatus Woesebacteria bacterium]